MELALNKLNKKMPEEKKEKDSPLSKYLFSKNEKSIKYCWNILDMDSYVPEVREGLI